MNVFENLKRSIFLLPVIFLLSGNIFAQHENIIKKVYSALNKGIEFYRSISINGGYVYSYSLDLKKKWGEGVTGDSTVEVQFPGTPGIGTIYLLAFETTNNEKYLEYAIETAFSLIKGQNSFGGWDHKIYFDSKQRKELVSFDDNQTQGVIRFLMHLDKHVNIPDLDSSINKALKLMLTSQFGNGAWPHLYPMQGNYHDYATFNDNGINDCIDVMIDAFNQYSKDEYFNSVEKAGKFIYISQLPPPQPGWAMQYNEFLQPAWARSFEPASLTPVTTLDNINSLIRIYLITNNEELLFPIRDAIDWVKTTRLPNGKYPRFVEIGTGKTLYYDRGRRKVSSVEELCEERRTQYAYEQDLAELLARTENNFEEIIKLGSDKYKLNLDRELTSDELNDSLRILKAQVNSILNTQDSLGRWVTKNNTFKTVNEDGLWSGGYETMDRINSKVFIENIKVLCKLISIINKRKN